MSTITTTFDPKPIPTTDYDWEAYRGDFEPGNAIGYGSTEKNAVMNLFEQEEKQ